MVYLNFFHIAHQKKLASKNKKSSSSSKDAFSIVADTVKYCTHILETLGPLCLYEAVLILENQVSTFYFYKLDT